ncbi:putative Short-chain dehydrogenase/reductase family 16C member 6 [Glarea lozoyensis 74030]|uniref:Putative Short-chain dehydrogenase/reductase family 16C member 6 n=1 Tax=Glarea lozoyensis (strain ATCC 74030 / MF5533) TaxID=1104152 RepID=H0EGV3_GLAL7|nr:putative Short-chain dehydrogenase/reductase family 16C member 6 [Glarea lozoyensis 74030]
MALPRTLSKPIRARIENVVFQSAIIALVLNYLPRLSEYIPYGFSRQALSAIPLARKLLKILWGFAIVKNLSGIASHVALNSWKTNEWNDEQEIVVVTGGSSGIGALVVRGFAERGAKVAILDLQEPKESLGPNISFYKCDVTSSSEISKVATEVRSKFGDPTVLINNAGIGFAETILGGTEAHLRATMNVNLLSHFLMVKEYLPSMVKRNKGHVVTVASMASVVTIASNVDYSCTKAGVLAFHEGLRQELDYRYNARLVRTSSEIIAWLDLEESTQELEQFEALL